ncbi:MAG: SGNH/GDSL hydrolase family protein [Pseudomonadota bacterium]
MPGKPAALPWTTRALFALIPLLLLGVVAEVGARLFGRAVLATRAATLPPLQNPEAGRRPVTSDPEATLKVLCVGDSWTFGMQMEDAEAYPGQLQTELREQHGIAGQVVNLGKPGADSFRAARVLRSQLPGNPAHLVIVQIGANQDRDPYDGDTSTGGMFTWTLHAALNHLATYRLLTQVVAHTRVMNDSRLNDQGGGEGIPLEGHEDVLFHTLDVNIGLMEDMALATGAQLLLVTYGLPTSIPARCSDTTHMVNEWIRDIAWQRDLPLVDMGLYYAVHGIPASWTLGADDDVPCSRLDPHPDARGYHLYAEQIGAWIAEHERELRR